MGSAAYPWGNFFDHLRNLNGEQLDDFGYWLFAPGMLFRASQQWWGRGGSRPQPHEGVDVCWFRRRQGERAALLASTLIPAPWAGQIVNITPDFLGQSIWLSHPDILPAGQVLLTALGHTDPLPHLQVGQTVAAGVALARLAAPARRSTVPPHLHLSVAILPPTIAPQDLSWQLLGQNPTCQLLDPLIVFPLSFAVEAA